MINLAFHSPEEEIYYPSITDHPIRLFLKRDDLIHPFISGNKWRKLKYHLIKAEENNKKHMVTFGGAYSNHILASAAAGARFNFKTTAFIRGEEVENPTLKFCRLFGMELIFVSREDYKDKMILYNQHFKNNLQTYFIDEGGFGLEAELGCREIVQELNQEYDHIFCAAGTGATSAGIINQIHLQGLKTQFHMIPVLKGGSFLREDIQKLLIENITFHLHEDYHFGGYAKTQPKLIDFIKDFTSKTAVLIDPVYTGKALFAIMDLASKNTFEKEAKILMIHTGGIFGTLGMLDKF
ncbi:MAG: pyridoxal-phosphate dependent enzyme [Bacteroidetes bacterium]|nr:pyridoxal-phosphate dependent enzyme [Bacteroidota bacterium]MBU1372136.1 pyridoxal-phosphate dependent enzyme [Bacteroidota bacterium]MBU1486356.1 pyridoxal-phosphate dependent enzyme [Bacteroidota bacterium]MBU1760342.1 pyridoxal-phosphate dependent enzyme [Bacteroidota bacterium]MBU2268308.1 pyridoxal-phosphate dependent enzyme [Bacteroidota bacterium]